jgi:hypothetical protein
VLCKYKASKSEINNKNALRNMLYFSNYECIFNGHRVKGKNQTKKYLELIDDKKTIYQNLWDIITLVHREVLNGKRKPEINKLSIQHLKLDRD